LGGGSGGGRAHARDLCGPPTAVSAPVRGRAWCGEAARARRAAAQHCASPTTPHESAGAARFTLWRPRRSRTGLANAGWASSARGLPERVQRTRQVARGPPAAAAPPRRVPRMHTRARRRRALCPPAAHLPDSVPRPSPPFSPADGHQARPVRGDGGAAHRGVWAQRAAGEEGEPPRGPPVPARRSARRQWTHAPTVTRRSQPSHAVPAPLSCPPSHRALPPCRSTRC
jgi:hypothetical protein